MSHRAKRLLLPGVALVMVAGLIGPVAAQQPNLTYSTYQNYQYPVFPTAVYCPGNMVVPPTLPGNTITYLNNSGINNGTASALNFSNAVYVDGEIATNHWISTLLPGEEWAGCGTQYTIRGGRHTFEQRADFEDDVVESNENDNDWAHQFVFTPYVLSESTPKDRGAPPYGFGGFSSIVDGSPIGYNCDGFRFASTGWWNVITMYSHDVDDDYDLELHAPSTGSENGFFGSPTGSFQNAGFLDALIVNRNTVGVNDYDVGVIDIFGDQESWFTIEQVVSQEAGVGSDMSVSLGTDDYLRIWDTYIGDTGWVTVSVDGSSFDGETIIVGWAEHDATQLALGDITDWEVTDEFGRARLHRDFTTTGWYGLIVYRNPSDGGVAKTINVKIELTPPDLMPLHLAGWHSPLVPTPEPIVSFPVLLPDELPGFMPQTYFSFSMENYSPTTSPLANMWILTDGLDTPAYTFSLPAMGPFSIWADYNTTGTEIPGGRHTLTMFIDPTNAIPEIFEDNNFWGEQFCWSPGELIPGWQHSHPAPGPYDGGWGTITSGEMMIANCDGYRLAVGASDWEGVVLNQGPSSDYDLMVHDPLVGVKDGFDDFLVHSTLLEGETDYVLFNNNLLSPGAFDVGVYNYLGDEPYTVEAVGSTSLPHPVSGRYGPYAMPVGNMLHLYSLFLDQDLYAFRLDNLSGTVDWGFGLHDQGEPLSCRQTMMEGGAAYLSGPGGPEWFTLDIPAAGWYCLAVFKVGPIEFDKFGEYQLTIMQGVTGVDDQPDLPSATALAGVHPNPFNPQTTISYDLVAATTVELDIFDLKGALVRRLVNGAVPAGRHKVAWNGQDEAGLRVASGTYFARFKAGSHHDVKKVMMVK